MTRLNLIRRLKSIVDSKVTTHMNKSNKSMKYMFNVRIEYLVYPILIDKQEEQIDTIIDYFKSNQMIRRTRCRIRVFDTSLIAYIHKICSKNDIVFSYDNEFTSNKETILSFELARIRKDVIR